MGGSRKEAGNDAVPSIPASDQRLDRVPVSAVAEREPVRHDPAQVCQMRGDGVRLRGGALHGNNLGQTAQAADQRGAELEMRGAGIVVDAQRKAALPCHRGEVLEHFVLGQRRIGHGSQETRGRTGRLGVLGKPHGFVRAQRTDADQDGRLPRNLLKRSIERSAALGTRKVGIGAGAAEQADGVDLRGVESGDEPAKGGEIDPALCVCRGDRESGESPQEHWHLGLAARSVSFVWALAL
jgi:hypothetical protein